VIEVAIGEYGTDVLDELFDVTKFTNINDRKKCLRISGEDNEAQLDNGAFSGYSFFVTRKYILYYSNWCNDNKYYANIFIL